MSTSLLIVVFGIAAIWLVVMVILAFFARGKPFQISSLTKNLPGATKLEAVGTPVKVIASMVVLAILGTVVWFVSGGKFRSVSKDGQGAPSSLTHIRPESQAGSEIKVLRADEWSEWIPIMWRKVAILPSDDGVVYEFRDDEGKVRSVTAEELRKRYGQDKDGRRNLKDTTTDVRFKAKTDVKYVVGRW